jgi:hypothetical protein
MEAALRPTALIDAGNAGAPVFDMQVARLAEARIPTDDGYLWPVLRGDMVTSASIRERMAEDLGRLLNERGGDVTITIDDYLRMGWTREQIDLHGARAVDLYDLQRCHAQAVPVRGAA